MSKDKENLAAAGADENIAQTVARLVQDREIATEVADNVVAIPEHWKLQDLEQFLDSPRRNDLNLPLQTLDGFAEYVSAHALPETSVYITENSATAVIDDVPAGSGTTAWRAHRAVLSLDRTPEWAAWSVQSGRFTAQRPFSDFIQDRAGEIEAPPLADLVQELRNISADSTGKRRDQVGHMSQSSERSGSTVISNNLPEFLDLQLPILKCEPAELTHLQARLYVKLADDGVQFCAQLVNEQVVIDRRIREFVERLKKRIGQKVPVYF